LDSEDQISQTIASSKKALSVRMNNLGLKPIIEDVDDRRLLITLPVLNAAELAAARNNITKSGVLEFRLVHPQSEQALADGAIVPGYEELDLKHDSGDEVEGLQPLLVKRSAERNLTGEYVTSAFVVRGPMGDPRISITFNQEGAAILAEITRQNVGNRLAIVVDGELYSAPVIRSEIVEGTGEISGSFSDQQARELANVMQNPLPVPVRIVEERSF
jgi:SecD/SecF fusion protein